MSEFRVPMVPEEVTEDAAFQIDWSPSCPSLRVDLNKLSEINYAC